MNPTRSAILLALAVVSTASATGPGPAYFQVRGATIIDPANHAVVEDSCVSVRGRRIESIVPCDAMPREGTVIDAAGHWLIPGLWDMHVHAVWHDTVYCTFFSEFVRNGVVGVRDMGGDVRVLADARAYLAHEDTIAPLLVAAGPFLDGPMPIHPEFSLAIADYDDGVAAVGTAVDTGAEFIKIYTLLPADGAMGVFDESRRRKLDVVGHLPAGLELDAAVAAGMRSIEHLAVETGGLCDVDAPGDPCAAVFDTLRVNGVYLTPTLLVRQRRTMLDDDDLLEVANVGRMPDTVAGDWLDRRSRWLQRTGESDRAELRAQYQRERALTVRAIESGSLILAGTDAGDLFVPPGVSLHEELELLVDAGMSEMQALQTASSVATAFLGLDERGRIAPGAYADLVLLDRNPLEDIRNTRAIASVILEGRVLSGRRSPFTCKAGR